MKVSEDLEDVRAPHPNEVLATIVGTLEIVIETNARAIFRDSQSEADKMCAKRILEGALNIRELLKFHTLSRKKL